MSHFTNIKTRFQNLLYLEKGLDSLNIAYRRKKTNNINSNLIIPQKNSYDIEFAWNENDCQYELVADMMFWEQPYPIEVFMEKIAQQYADKVITGESKKIGFQTIKCQPNVDGSNTLILERWKI